jgi:uncharacterized Fe-S radical SAM superfamily protein PflX
MKYTAFTEISHAVTTQETIFFKYCNLICIDSEEMGTAYIP